MGEPRLDILIYGHDGRGLGHVGRSAAIGMALRRLYPHLKVCLLTGCRQTQELIGAVPLDWLKLPAYDTLVSGGRSTGIEGPSGFADGELGRLRGAQIRQIVALYRPRLVLVDHTPQGKHRELVPALEAQLEERPRWVLGVRGVIGSVAQAASDLAVELYRKHYGGLLWYGDRRVLGADHLETLAGRFGAEVRECGYVSRLIELTLFARPPAFRRGGCTVSMPWFGEHGDRFFDMLVEALALLGPGYGRFRIFVGDGDLNVLRAKLEGLDFCTLERFGSHYVEALQRSRSAVVFGGYNSLVDVLSIGIPALVVLRAMQDREQQEHLGALTTVLGGRLSTISEADCSVEQLYTRLTALLASSFDPFGLEVDLGGAETAARALAGML